MVSVPEQLSAAYIAERWPRLYHMAEAGSWSSIERNGLLSTSALLDFFEMKGEERQEIEARRRPQSVRIIHPEHGEVWIRDNKPINETVLKRTLEGMSLAEWYRTLNGRVFFWLTPERLDKLRSAGAYAEREHDILTLDTAALLAAYAEEVELAHLNTGAVHAGATCRRGAGTFRRIADYPWKERLTKDRSETIVELTVPGMVADVGRFVVAVETR